MAKADVRRGGAAPMRVVQVTSMSGAESLMASEAEATRKAKQKAAISQQHPLYGDWIDVWRDLAYVYEGDGPYLTGDALVAHPRELIYAADADGAVDMTRVVGEKDKFVRRKRLAKYENLAQYGVDIIMEHQYSKLPNRSFTSTKGKSEAHPYMKWTENVDGEGTHLDDWLKDNQTMAAVFGMVWVLMDFVGAKPVVPGKVRSKLDDGYPILRTFIPPDCMDWLAPRRRPTAAKFVEARERTSLLEASPMLSGAGRSGELLTVDELDVEYLIVTDKDWTRYDREGSRMEGATHRFGRAPITTLYSRRRRRIPIIGRSLLGDPKMYQDLYNLSSEQRELLRAQTFSMLNIILGQEETVDEARGRLGASASTETVIFSKGAANFIAPPDGPVDAYSDVQERAERRVFRLAGLPWESDSKDAESEGSRKLKAADLERILNAHADEAERTDYDLCLLWHLATYGEEGYRKYIDAGFICQHPEEFHVQQILETVEDAQAGLSLGMGPTANALIRKQALPIILKNIDEDTRKEIEAEIDELSENETVNELAMQEALLAGAEGEAEGAVAGAEKTRKEAKAPVEGVGGGKKPARASKKAKPSKARE